MYLIVGLGNPGLKYKNTRHNAGFCAIEELARRAGLRFSKKRFSGAVAEGTVAGERVALLKPYTFMNLSGDAVAEAARFYKLPPQNIIVLYDDIDLELGRLRVRSRGSAGTHNGMRSILARLRTEDFPRVRIGIGKNPPYMQLADYVLAKLRGGQRQALAEACALAAAAAEEIVAHGPEAAMARFNGKPQG